jgi:Flp pilus assembly protein TadD
VAGLLQVGEQAWADRYAYLPLTGCFVIAAWSVPALAAAARVPRGLLALAGGAAVALLAAAAFRQTRFWRDDERLFTRALAVTEGNWIAHNNLGAHDLRAGKTARAVAHFREAILLAPRPAKAHGNLGQGLLREGKLEEAIAEFREAVREDPAEYPAWRGLGSALELRGDVDGALVAYERSLRISPDDPRTLRLVDGLLSRRERAEAARRRLEGARGLP